jgi:two-component system, OmpR family, sensor kinase
VSLRTRLLVGLGIVALVLGVAAVAVTRSADGYLVGQVDDRLPTRVDDQWDRGGAWRDESATDPGARPGGPALSPYYVGVVDGDSVVFVQDPDVQDGGDADTATPDIDADRAREAAAASEDGDIFTAGSDSTDRYRVRAITENGQVWVVAASLADVDAAVGRLVRVEVVATGVVLALLALVAFWVLRLGVRPLKSMARTATTVASGADLSQRVPDAPAGTEAGDLGTALNTMLARLETAFADQQASEERLRRFVADASHELRTPVATIRGYAELYRTGGLDDAIQLDQAMRRTEAEVRRMGDLVDDLLLLARLDQGRPLERGPVDLGVLAVDAAADARAMAPGRPVRAKIEEAVVVEGDEHRLRQVVANLVRNAIVHTPPDAAITVAAHRRDGRGVVEVRDEGPGMAPDQAARAFERFYRADPGRARDRGGSGLGLAIVRAVAAAHRGSATLVSDPGVGTTVTVEVPLPAASLAATPAGAKPDT